MKRRLVLILVALTLGLGGAGIAQGTSTARSPLAAAKTCGRGWVHGIIDHQHKCLRAGQFCAVRFDRQYRRYGFTCPAGRLKRR